MFSEFAAYRAFRDEGFARYRDFPRIVPQERWQAMCDRVARARPDAWSASSARLAADDEVAAQVEGGRDLATSVDAMLVVIECCELDCGEGAWDARRGKSIGGILQSLWNVEPPFRRRLKGEELEAMRAAWTRLARTLGIDPYGIRDGLPDDETPPWWALPGEAFVGLTPPAKLADLGARLADTGLVAKVAAHARRDGYPGEAADLVSLGGFLRKVANKNCWLLARQAPT